METGSKPQLRAGQVGVHPTAPRNQRGAVLGCPVTLIPAGLIAGGNRGCNLPARVYGRRNTGVPPLLLNAAPRQPSLRNEEARYRYPAMLLGVSSGLAAVIW
jgi:hypothetical protein